MLCSWGYHTPKVVRPKYISDSDFKHSRSVSAILWTMQKLLLPNKLTNVPLRHGTRPSHEGCQNDQTNYKSNKLPSALKSMPVLLQHQYSLSYPPKLANASTNPAISCEAHNVHEQQRDSCMLACKLPNIQWHCL